MKGNKWVISKLVVEWKRTEKFSCKGSKISCSTEEIETTPVTGYWSSSHPHLAHLPQLPHPLTSSTPTGEDPFEKFN